MLMYSGTPFQDRMRDGTSSTCAGVRPTKGSSDTEVVTNTSGTVIVVAAYSNRSNNNLYATGFPGRSLNYAIFCANAGRKILDLSYPVLSANHNIKCRW